MRVVRKADRPPLVDLPVLRDAAAPPGAARASTVWQAALVLVSHAPLVGEPFPSPALQRPLELVEPHPRERQRLRLDLEAAAERRRRVEAGAQQPLAGQWLGLGQRRVAVPVR